MHANDLFNSYFTKSAELFKNLLPRKIVDQYIILSVICYLWTLIIWMLAHKNWLTPYCEWRFSTLLHNRATHNIWYSCSSIHICMEHLGTFYRYDYSLSFNCSRWIRHVLGNYGGAGKVSRKMHRMPLSKSLQNLEKWAPELKIREKEVDELAHEVTKRESIMCLELYSRWMLFYIEQSVDAYHKDDG